MKNRILALVTLAALGYACIALNKYDAESFYGSAVTYFESNDFRNALRSAHLARDAFQTLGIDEGVSRCNQLITKVDSILNDAQMANAYFDIASGYFLEENPTVSSYMKAKEMAEYARDFYNRAGDGNGVLQCDDLISRSQSEIGNIRNQKQQIAYAYYKMAQDAFFNGEYLTARSYAINSSVVYNEILDDHGITNTASLITSIDFKINETRYNAIASYDRALDYYTSKDYSSAVKYASISQQLYKSINDVYGMNKATGLITRINSESIQLTEQRLREAQSAYDKSEEMLIIRDYVNATEYARQSRSIYMEFLAKAQEEEEGLPQSEKLKTKLYSSYINKVDDLFRRINSEWGSEKKKTQAETFYTKAQEYYLQGQPEFALNYIDKARIYFTDLNDYIGVSKCSALLDSINNMIAVKREADGYYNQAYSFYKTAEFENALVYVGKARNLYDRILNRRDTEKADNLTLMIRQGFELRDSASRDYQSAIEYFNAGDYGSAKLYSEKAHTMYLQINYSLGIINSEQLLNQSSEKVYESYAQFRNTSIAAILIILIGGYLLLSKLREQRTFKKEMKIAKQEFDEEKKVKEKEWDIVKEEETQNRVEDELRRLIEEERKQTGFEGPEHTDKP
jgi:hypothetical protein